MRSDSALMSPFVERKFSFHDESEFTVNSEEHRKSKFQLRDKEDGGDVPQLPTTPNNDKDFFNIMNQ